MTLSTEVNLIDSRAQKIAASKVLSSQNLTPAQDNEYSNFVLGVNEIQGRIRQKS